ncbi:MAG: hypothetical protein ACI9XO_003163, partial [Paraglaciecola sp.]
MKLTKTLYLATFAVCLFAMPSFLQAQVSFSQESNILSGTFSGLDCAVDMNGDFLDDVVVVNGSGITIHYQQQDGSFTSQAFNMDIDYAPDWSIAAGDLDNNGYNDLLLGNGQRVTFLIANEDGSAYSQDMHPEYIFSQRSTFADIDNDGNLDAFVCHDVDQSHPYRSDGNGGMTLDQTLIETIDLAGNYAALWVDYDNDWDTDLYVTKCRQGSSPGDIERTNRMYRNNGDGTYTEVADDINMADNAQSWATVFEDFDNDGDFDAFIVNHDEANRFMINNGAGVYEDIIDDVNIAKNDLGAWEASSADFDNDGYMDIFSELGKEIYMNNGNMTFSGVDIPIDDGALGDFNNDGFVDILKGGTIWMNEGNDNNWLTINTIGIQSNRNGVGARVEIYGAWGVQIREVRAGQSFSPMSTLNIHFGIGEAEEVEMVVVKWPSGLMTMIENPTINTTLTLSEIDADCFADNVTIEANGPTLVCAGETVEIIAPEGTEYLWSTGETTQSITVSQTGNYNVILTHADDCVSFSNNIVVSNIQDTAPEISVEGQMLFCEGGSVMLTASESIDYTWSNSETTQTIEVTESGQYMVTTTGQCTDDLISELIEVTVLDAPLPEVEDVTTNSQGTATITGIGDNLVWYDEATSGTALATGDVFETGILTEETVYYVENVQLYPGDLQDGGKPNMNGGGGIPGTGSPIFFDAYEPFTLLSVLVSVPEENTTPGIRTVQLIDENTAVLYSQEFDLDYGDHVLTLDWAIPAGTNLGIRCVENNLFRNNNGVSYPYPIGDVGQLTGTNFGGGWYYYFYDWKIQKQGFECVSDRVEVTVFLTGTNEEELFSNLAVFPNPAQDELNIQFALHNQQALNIELLDVVGRVIWTETMN